MRKLKLLHKIIGRIEQSPIFKSLDQQKIWSFVHEIDVRGLLKWIAENNSSGVGYHQLTTRKLKWIAQSRGIRNYSNLSKDELIVQIVRTDSIHKDIEK